MPFLLQTPAIACGSNALLRQIGLGGLEMGMAYSLPAAIAALIVGTTTAVAADAPKYYEPAPSSTAPSSFDWSGPYLGLHAGLGTGDFDYEIGVPGTLPLPLNFSSSGSGFFGGAQVGYDWQSGNWVVGALADVAASNYSAELSARL